jgi:hypothetical protein
LPSLCLRREKEREDCPALPLCSRNVKLETVDRDRGAAAGFTEKGLLPSKELAHWRPPPAGHEEPRPEADEIVSFLTFYERGLGHPAHPFLLGLLNEWGLELQHLNPNRVLHITGIATLCQGFLGIDPHVNMFRAFFYG